MDSFSFIMNSCKNNSRLVQTIVALLFSAANHFLNRLTRPSAIIATSKPFKKMTKSKPDYGHQINVLTVFLPSYTEMHLLSLVHFNMHNSSLSS